MPLDFNLLVHNSLFRTIIVIFYTVNILTQLRVNSKAIATKKFY